MTETYTYGDDRKYVVGDATTILQQYEDQAAAIFLDDAWARPMRAGQFGVEYDTHKFKTEPEEDAKYVDDIDDSTTTVEIIDACYESLLDGGWLVADADDWLLPRLTTYLQQEWGDVAQSYSGGGYRKIGGVTYLSSDGTPDRSTAGMYLSTGGYPVVFAHKGETTRQTSTSARQISSKERNNYDWGSVKPIEPYTEWIEALVEPTELIIVPCAGTAPAAIAAEKAFGDEARYICIDTQDGARQAFEKRRNKELGNVEQQNITD